MKRRVATAAVLVPVALAVIYWAPLALFLACISAVILLALREFSRLLGSHGARVRPVSYAAAALMPWLMAFQPSLLPAALVLTLLAVLAASLLIADPAGGIPEATGNLFGIVYISVPLSLLLLFRPDPGPAWSPRPGHEMLAVLLAVWTSDTCAYFAGKAFGRHHLLPRLSPGKTLEGFAAGLAGPVLLMLFAGPALLPGRSAGSCAAAGALIAVAGMGGDLFESLLKRSAGVKDSSTLLPGHGGVLDRIDSLLTAFPAWYLLETLLESGSGRPC
ncbi:MAG: phosphatidate cytidylyltransferase [Acidobacteriota bacterium]